MGTTVSLNSSKSSAGFGAPLLFNGGYFVLRIRGDRPEYLSSHIHSNLLSEMKLHIRNVMELTFDVLAAWRRV